MCPSNICCFDFRVEVDDALIIKLYREWIEVAPNYFGDYYPLTEYTLAEDAWMAVQFNAPDSGRGHVQAFRRKECPQESGGFKLRGLDPESHYIVKNFDDPETRRISGRELMEEGLRIEIPEQPGAAVVAYEKEG